MDEQFSHPRAEDLLAKVRSLFKDRPVFQRRDRPIIFLCGGPVQKSGMGNMRSQFLVWSQLHLPNIVCLLAEIAFRHTTLYDPPEYVNLSEFETVVGKIADCILIFPESEGSFAELGLFSNVSEIRNKVLVANAITYQAKESFINRGPISTINRESYLSPSVQISKRGRSFDFTPIQERLERMMARSHRKSFEYAPYRKLDYLGKFLITLEIINIVSFVSLESLSDCIRAAFGAARPKELKRVLSILAGAGYIRVSGRFFSLGMRRHSLLEFDGVRIEDTKARILDYYERHRSVLYDQFRRALR
jgi:hypothetical protein